MRSRYDRLPTCPLEVGGHVPGGAAPGPEEAVRAGHHEGHRVEGGAAGQARALHSVTHGAVTGLTSGNIYINLE